MELELRYSLPLSEEDSHSTVLQHWNRYTSR